MSKKKLYKKGEKLIKAAYEYWKEYQKCRSCDAVVWLEDTSGHIVLFTRGEYKEQIMNNIATLEGELPLKKPFIFTKEEASNENG